MVGNGRNNVLFLMYVRFLRSSSRVKFFGLRNCLLQIGMVKVVFFFTTSKPICSKSNRAVCAKIANVVEGDTLCGCAANGFSQVPNILALGGQIWTKF